MPLSTLSADDLLAYWAANYGKYASLHSAYSASGASELAGGSPAYARVAATWGTPASNSMALAGSLPYNVNVPASTTVAWIGFWDALTSGNFHGMVPAGNQQGYAFTAPSSTSTFLAPGSAYTSNQMVVVLPAGGASLPSGITAGAIYYVKSPSGDSFQLSAASGPGAAVTLTSDGSGIVQAIAPEVFGAAGTYQITSGSWSFV